MGEERRDLSSGFGRWVPLVVLLVVVCGVSVLSWPGRLYGSDPIAYREEAGAILLRGELHVDMPVGALSRPGEYFVQNPRNGFWYSKYGVLNAVASLPALAVEYRVRGELGGGAGGVGGVGGPGGVVYLNVYNTVLAVGLGWVLYWVAAMYTRKRWVGVGFVLGVMFGSFVWNYLRAQATELVQVILAVVAFGQLVRVMRGGDVEDLTGRMPVPRGRGLRVAVIWLCVGALVLSRLYYATLIPAVVWGLWRGRVRWWGLVGPVVAVLMVLGWVNYVKFGSAFASGYHVFDAGKHVPGWNPWPGLWGFLVSAQKSVWVHFPWVGFALVFWRGFWRRYGGEARMLAMGAGLYVLPLCTIPSWAGDWAYGPRYLLFGLPLVALPVLGVGEMMGKARWVLVGGMGVAMGVEVWMSGYVNRFDFFAAYELRAPLRRAAGVVRTAAGGPDDGAMYPGKGYFDRRPWGVLMWELAESGGDVEKLGLYREVKGELTAGQDAEFRQVYGNVYGRGNWYWGMKEEPRR